jgi:multimeric flavodoxin WrbA
MKILTIQGSPRKAGNTARALGWAEEEFARLGHEVESVSLRSKEIKGCLACARCKEDGTTIGCVQKDDGLAILEKMVGADLVLFASPLYFWGIAGPLKTLVDRTYSLYVNLHRPDHASLVAGQRQALLVTGAGPYKDNADLVFTAFERLRRAHLSVNAGGLFLDSCTTPENMDEGVKAKVVAFVAQITS